MIMDCRPGAGTKQRLIPHMEGGEAHGRSPSNSRICWTCDEVVTGDHYASTCPKLKKRRSRPGRSHLTLAGAGAAQRRGKGCPKEAKPIECCRDHLTASLGAVLGLRLARCWPGVTAALTGERTPKAGQGNTPHIPDSAEDEIEEMNDVDEDEKAKNEKLKISW